MHDGTRRAIVAAFLANLGIAIAKFVAFAVTGSASILAESIHSVADTGNQALLALGGRRGARRPRPRIPSASGANATSGHSWWPSCCSPWAHGSRGSKDTRSCATRCTLHSGCGRSHRHSCFRTGSQVCRALLVSVHYFLHELVMRSG